MQALEVEEADAEKLISNSISTAAHVAHVSSFSAYSSKVNWCVFGFICIFTLGSWLDISGLWCELPFLVDELPEGWRLPSILSAISQIAQLGPLILLLFKLLCPTRIDNVKIIYTIFIIGAFACFCLSFLWNRTVMIFGEKRSIYLYIFNFGLSLLDGMSTLTFLPYIGEHFAKEYILANYVGESLCSLIPGLLAMAQGLDTSDEHCNKNTNSRTNNLTNTTTTSASITKVVTNTSEEAIVNLHRPNFSVSVYFFLMFLLLLSSIVAFTVLNFARFAIAERRKKLNIARAFAIEDDEEDDGLGYSSSTDNMLRSFPRVEFSGANDARKQRAEIRLLLTLTFLVSLVFYGYLPGLLSYSTIPYAPKFLNLSMNLSNLFLPVSIIISIWSYQVSTARIVYESIVPFSISTYILTISLMSPCPFLVGNNELGGYIIVVCWIVQNCMFMRIRCLVATQLEKYGKNILFTLGCFTILGQFIGGWLIYIQVDVYRMFADKPKCASANFCFTK